MLRSLALFLLPFVLCSAAIPATPLCGETLLTEGSAPYLRQAALADLVLQRADVLQLNDNARRYLRDLVHVAGFVPSGGNKRSWYRVVSRPFEIALIELLWTQLPFAWRGIGGSATYEFAATYLQRLVETKGPAVAEAVGLALPTLHEIVRSTNTYEPHLGRRLFRRKLSRVSRSLALSTALTLAGLHPVIDTAKHLYDRNLQRGYDYQGIGVPAVLNTAEQEEQVVLHGKKILYLVSADTYEQFYSSSQRHFFRTPSNRRMRAEAASFELRSFQSGKELIQQLNRTSDVDVLLIENHGRLGEKERVGTFSVDGEELGALLADIDTLPIRPGGNIFYVVCYLGATEHEPGRLDDELWIQLSRKKLPKDGKAFASTMPLWGDSVGGLGKEIGGIVFPNAVQAAIGPGMLFFAGALGHPDPRRWQDHPRYYFPPGFRVYDRATESTRFYQSNVRGNPTLQTEPPKETK